MLEITLGVILFTAIVMALVGIILLARARLVATGKVTIRLNEERDILMPVGMKLSAALAAKDIFVPTACGGGGSCGQCRVKIFAGGGDILPTERGLINRRDAAEGARLSCQVVVKRDMQVEVPPEVFGVKKIRVPRTFQPECLDLHQGTGAGDPRGRGN